MRIDGIWYNGIGNVGFKPTVSDENRMLIENNLLDYSGDAYGKEVEIQLYHFKRPEQKFESIEMMKAQIDQDITYAKEFSVIIIRNNRAGEKASEMRLFTSQPVNRNMKTCQMRER